MKKILFSILIVFILFANSNAQLKRETRAVWIATNFGLDWPDPDQNAAQQKRSLVDIIDNIAKLNYNTVYFQVRRNGEVLFNSSFEPYSEYLDLDYNGHAQFDPLKTAIEECHKRGIEIHAWFNVLRLANVSEKRFLSKNEIFEEKPEWYWINRSNGSNEYWLDSGLPEVQNYIDSLTTECVKRYNFDGLHLDFLRYPNGEIEDEQTYKLYGKGKDLHDWRRDNISNLLGKIYNSTKRINPELKVGVTPLGIYKKIGQSNGLEAFEIVYQDSREWIKRNIIDYLVPQIYWNIDDNPKFGEIAVDWIRNNRGKNIVLGIGAYKEEVVSEIDEILEISRKIKADGVAIFRYGNIIENSINLFSDKALPSQMDHIDKIPPLNADSLKADITSYDQFRINLSWKYPLLASDGDPPSYFTLYETSEQDRKIPLKIFKANRTSLSFTIDRPQKQLYKFALSSIDNLGNESKVLSNSVNIVLPKLDSVKQTMNKSNPMLVKMDDRHYLIIHSGINERAEIVVNSRSNEIKLEKGFNYFILNDKEIEKIVIRTETSKQEKQLTIKEKQ